MGPRWFECFGVLMKRVWWIDANGKFDFIKHSNFDENFIKQFYDLFGEQFDASCRVKTFNRSIILAVPFFAFKSDFKSCFTFVFTNFT